MYSYQTRHGIHYVYQTSFRECGNEILSRTGFDPRTAYWKPIYRVWLIILTHWWDFCCFLSVSLQFGGLVVTVFVFSNINRCRSISVVSVIYSSKRKIRLLGKLFFINGSHDSKRAAQCQVSNWSFENKKFFVLFPDIKTPNKQNKAKLATY